MRESKSSWRRHPFVGVGVALCLLVITPGLVGQGLQPKVSSITIPQEVRAGAAILADATGDGLEDLVLTARSSAKSRSRARTFLRVHRGLPNGTFEDTASVVRRISNRSSGFAVVPGGGVDQSLLVLRNRSAHAALEDARASSRPLFEAELLWQAFGGQGAAALDAHFTPDFDGDGLADLAIPEIGGVRVLRRTLDEDKALQWSPSVLLPRPLRAADVEHDPEGLRRFNFRRRQRALASSSGIDIGDSRSARASLITLGASLPVPHYGDFDGDGRLDAWIRGVDRVHIHRCREDGSFVPEPDHRLDLPTPIDRSRQLDGAFGIAIGDVNGDRRSDLVMSLSREAGSELDSQILLYLQGESERTDAERPLFGPGRRPSQLIPVTGLAVQMDLRDFDGDGTTDLGVVVWNPGGGKDLRSRGGGGVTVKHLVFRGEGGRFERRASTNSELRLESQDDEFGFQMLDAGELGGGRARELLIRNGPRSVALYTQVPGREGPARFQAIPGSEYEFDHAGSLKSLPREGDKPLRVLWISGRKITCLTY